MKTIFLALFISLFNAGNAQKSLHKIMDSSFNNIIGMDIELVNRRVKIDTSNNLKFCLSHFKISGKIVNIRTRLFESVYVDETYFSINKNNRISLVIFMINHRDNQKVSDSLKYHLGKPDKTLHTDFSKVFDIETEDPVSYFWRFHNYGFQLLSDICSGYDLLLLTNNDPEQYFFHLN
ncbi:MAG: hypothetical protein FD183_157 [Chitinophagaceae bacterium]|nr:MAG: hypothetical protein FD183_157 [Chitinophagaceae bacterium]